MLAFRKLWLRLFLLAGFVLALAIITTAFFLCWKRTKAARLLDEVRTERWSSVNFEQARGISERYGGHPGTFGRRGMPCIASNCRFDIEISNSPLDYLHLAPETDFYVSIHVKDNSVDHIGSGLLSVILVGSPPQKAELGAHVGEDIKQIDPTVPGYMSTINMGDALPGAPIITVGLMPTATLEEKRVAYDFNLSCLTKIGGCKSVRDFLPKAAEMALKHAVSN